MESNTSEDSETRTFSVTDTQGSLTQAEEAYAREAWEREAHERGNEKGRYQKSDGSVNLLKENFCKNDGRVNIIQKDENMRVNNSHNDGKSQNIKKSHSLCNIVSLCI